ncbi:MAG: ergothioneine biosynthesis protein EgtB [Glaciimonas sp.]|nr:ergothioneine biosynthesis protein EgtB [Glaciimonas sp.]
MTMLISLLAEYDLTRQATMALADPLSDEDCCVQSMPDASPVKWHLAHTTWFFETFVLEQFELNFKPHHPAYRVLFNSYYHGVGNRHPRPRRGLITRPSLAEVEDYRSNVDARMEALILIAAGLPPARVAELVQLVTLGLQHEQQHQELLLTDVLHLLSCNPLLPAYAAGAVLPLALALPLHWQQQQGGVVEIGHAGGGFCFDNELPRHRQFVEPFALASRLVTNGEYLAFIEAGAYRHAALWLSEGWDWLQAQQLTWPLYWRQIDGEWHEFTLNGLQLLDVERAVTQLSYFEADAYARWFDARLPSEAEWECAVASESDAEPLLQLFDTAWQWTSSSYAPYPGFRASADAIGEYNGKFMVNQYVLRGASCATPIDQARPSYRNFFPASARWQFSGIRLARS